MTPRAVPGEFHTATPYLFVRDGVRAIEFYVRAFGATERLRLAGPGGTLGHGEIRIGDSVIMLADEVPAQGALGPQSLGGAGVALFLYVEDVDAFFSRAIAAGATVVRPVADLFYGDRVGTLRDPFGHVWSIATHMIDLSRDELLERAAEFVESASPAESP